jgi:prepilin-type N-terminal cleavage/methylation domain-containing protein/prepilin-type processing-associated H-X9-DG protein
MNRSSSPDTNVRRRGLRIHHAPSGFTLLEIVVVTAILAVLAALLFSVFGRVRTQAQTTTCASHLRQIGVALRLYISDNAGYYPEVAFLDSAKNCSWVDRIYGYVRSPAVFVCPNHPDGQYEPGCAPSMPIERNADGDVIAKRDGSYLMNSIVYPPVRIKENRIQFPSSLIVVSDGNTNMHEGFLGNAYVAPGSEVLSEEKLKMMGVFLRHNEGNNALFADGHVKWQSLTSLTRRGLWRLDGDDNPPP